MLSSEARSSHRRGDNWVTVFGVRPECTDDVLRVMSSCGTILSREYPSCDEPNFIHVQFEDSGSATRALALHGTRLGSSHDTMIGVTPYHKEPTATTKKPLVTKRSRREDDADSDAREKRAGRGCVVLKGALEWYNPTSIYHALIKRVKT
eukprot:PhM_4_TR11393/c0_g10_i1/m.84224